MNRVKRSLTALVLAFCVLGGSLGAAAAPVIGPETAEITLEMVGAGIRPTGGDMRFAARLQKTETVREHLEELRYGVLIVPERLLERSGYTPDELTLESAGRVAAWYDMSQADIVFYAAGVYAEDEESMTFTGVFRSIPREEYDTEMVGRAFVQWGDSVWYADPLIRTFYGVAEQAAGQQSDENMAQMLTQLLGSAGRTAAAVTETEAAT